MTGYLGGATDNNVRVGDSSYIFTAVLGVLVWLGLELASKHEPNFRGVDFALSL